MDRRTGAVGDTAPGGKENMFRRGKVGDPLRRSERETSGPCEPLQPGEVRDTRCADFRCRWPVVDESLRSGPMRASASTTARAARSEAERAEREAGQMRSCTPILVGTRAAGIRCQIRTAPRRARRGAIVNPQAPSHADPRTARRHEGAGARQKAFFSFGPCTARFLFGKTDKKMGGALPSYQHS